MVIEINHSNIGTAIRKKDVVSLTLTKLSLLKEAEQKKVLLNLGAVYIEQPCEHSLRLHINTIVGVMSIMLSFKHQVRWTGINLRNDVPWPYDVAIYAHGVIGTTNETDPPLDLTQAGGIDYIWKKEE